MGSLRLFITKVSGATRGFTELSGLVQISTSHPQENLLNLPSIPSKEEQPGVMNVALLGCSHGFDGENTSKRGTVHVRVTRKSRGFFPVWVSGHLTMSL